MFIKQADEFTLLPEKAKEILKEKSYAKDCYPLDELINVVIATEKNVRAKVFWYKWSGLILLVSIPLISALLSVIITQDSEATINSTNTFRDLLPVAPYLSLGLTLMTILNSIFKPGERFRTACLMSIKVSHFRADILADLEKLPSAVSDDVLLKVIHKNRKDFEFYQEQLVGLFLPEAVRK